MTRVFIFLFILTSTNGFACICAPIIDVAEIQKSEKENSECIFIGDVFDINLQDLTYKVRVIESFDGGDEIGNVYIGKNWKTCIPFIEKKGKWLIYGHMEDGYLKTNPCGISRSFGNPVIIYSVPSSESLRCKSKIELEAFLKSKRKNDYKLAKTQMQMELKALREDSYGE